MRTLRIPRPRTPGLAVGTAGIAAVVVLGVTGCASKDEPEDGKPTIGVTLSAASNPFYLAEGQAIEQAAKTQGVEASVQYANADVAVQSDQIDAFVRRGVDAIVVDAVDSEGVGPAVLRAKQAGIPVVAVDVAATGADASVTSDNVQAGRDACTYLFQQLGGKGKVAIVDGSAVSAIADRMNGCREAVKANPGIEVVATQRADLTRDKSMDVAGNILAAHPDVQGFFGVNDPTAIGIALAAEQKNTKVKVVGVDGARQLTELLPRGTIIGTSGQHPEELGRQALDMAMRLALGEKLEQTSKLIPTMLVNAETVGQYKSWG